MHKIWTVAAAVLLVQTGCGDRSVNSAGNAMPPDAAIPDSPRPDQRRPDLPLPPDLPPLDLPLPPDLPLPDLGVAVLPPGKVLYYDSPWPGSQQLMQIGSDGKGGKVSPGFSQAVQLRGLRLAGTWEMPLDRSRPASSGQASDYDAICLPGGKGELRGYSTSAGVGMLLIRPGGQVKPLDFAKGPVKGSGNVVAVDKSGTVLAWIALLSGGSEEVRLVRTDGKVFAGTGKNACSVTPKAAPIVNTEAGSLSIAGKWLFFLTHLAGVPGHEVLMRAPADCSAPVKEVPLPKVNGATPFDLGRRLARSDDGSVVALVARYQHAKGPQEVFAVETATAKVINISSSPGSYLEVRHSLMYDHAPWGASTSLSPKGTRLAYTGATGVLTGLTHNLMIKQTGAAAKPALVLSGGSGLPASHKVVDCPTWLGEDDLTFWSGPSMGHMDMYHYRFSSAALTNLTNSGSPPILQPRGGWWSRNGKYLYYLEHRPPPPSGWYGTSEIKAVVRSTGKRIHVTSGLNINGAYYSAEPATGSGRIFFSASPAKQVSGRFQDLYVFDQDTASAPVRLTHFTAPPKAVQSIYGIATNAKGTAAAFSLGSTPPHDIYTVQVGPPVKVNKLNSGQVITRRRKLFGPNGKTLFHISMGSSNTWNLLGQPLAGGGVKVLRANLGKESSVLVVW